MTGDTATDDEGQDDDGDEEEGRENDNDDGENHAEKGKTMRTEPPAALLVIFPILYFMYLDTTPSEG